MFSLRALMAIKLSGGVYLLWLAYKSFKSAASRHDIEAKELAGGRRTRFGYFKRGHIIQMTNPKAAGERLRFGVQLRKIVDIRHSQLNLVSGRKLTKGRPRASSGDVRANAIVFSQKNSALPAFCGTQILEFFTSIDHLPKTRITSPAQLTIP